MKRVMLISLQQYLKHSFHFLQAVLFTAGRFLCYDFLVTIPSNMTQEISFPSL